MKPLSKPQVKDVKSLLIQRLEEYKLKKATNQLQALKKDKRYVAIQNMAVSINRLETLMHKSIKSLARKYKAATVYSDGSTPDPNKHIHRDITNAINTDFTMMTLASERKETAEQILDRLFKKYSKKI